jgi:hypothetical protein
VSPIRASRAAENVRKTKIPSIGIASSAPERETALFTPEASPECLTSTEFNAVVVSGAMTNDIPKQDAAVEGGPPEAAGEAEYPEIFVVHDVFSPALAFSIPTLAPGSFPRSVLSRFVRVIRTDHPRGDLLSDYYVAAGFAFRSFLLAQHGRDALDRVTGVGLDPAHIPIC